MNVVGCDNVFHGSMSELVRLAIGDAGPKASAGEPRAVALPVVISAVVGGVAVIFGDG